MRGRRFETAVRVVPLAVVATVIQTNSRSRLRTAAEKSGCQMGGRTDQRSHETHRSRRVSNVDLQIADDLPSWINRNGINAAVVPSASSARTSPPLSPSAVVTMPRKVAVIHLLDHVLTALSAAREAPIRVKDVVGFAVNRLLHALLLESIRLVEEGVLAGRKRCSASAIRSGHSSFSTMLPIRCPRARA